MLRSVYAQDQPAALCPLRAVRYRPTLIATPMKMLLHLRCLLTAVLGLGALLALGRPANAVETTTLDAIRARGYLLCGIGEAQAGFSRVGRRRRALGPRRGILHGTGLRRVRQQGCGEVLAVERQRSLQGAAGGRRRRAGARGDVDLEPRHRAWRALCRGAVLRRPGLSHPPRQCGGERAGAVGRLHLRAAGGDGRAGGRRLSSPHSACATRSWRRTTGTISSRPTRPGAARC